MISFTEGRVRGATQKQKEPRITTFEGRYRGTLPRDVTEGRYRGTKRIETLPTCQILETL